MNRYTRKPYKIVFSEFFERMFKEFKGGDVLCLEILYEM